MKDSHTHVGKVEFVPSFSTYNHNLSKLEEGTDDNGLSKNNTKLEDKIEIREGHLKTSDFGAFLHVIKSSLGTGLLAMPSAFHNIGLLMGFIGTAFVALICAHCTYILVNVSHHFCRLKGKSEMSYVDTVETAFRMGAGGKWRELSTFMRYSANFFMFVTMYGVNTVYVILIASTFKQVLENHLDFSMNIRWYMLLLTLVLLPVGIVRHIKFLVPFSALANIFLLVGCSLTIYLCSFDMPSPLSRPMVVDMKRWPLFLSTVLFGMEGIGTVLPIENAMRTPGHFLGCPGVLNFSMAVVGSMYLVVGVVGYIRFGENVAGSVTLNLPEDALSETVKVLVALSILFTYPLQLTASINVVWNKVQHSFSKKNQNFGYYFIRALLILGTVAIGIAMPNLGPVMSLVGAIGFSGLGLLLPALADTIAFWEDISQFKIFKNFIIVLIWAIAAVSGSLTSVHEIIVEYHI